MNTSTLTPRIYLDQIPEQFQAYINFESVARDLFIDSFYSAHDSQGIMHVFIRC